MADLECARQPAFQVGIDTHEVCSTCDDHVHETQPTLPVVGINVDLSSKQLQTPFIADLRTLYAN